MTNITKDETKSLLDQISEKIPTKTKKEIEPEASPDYMFDADSFLSEITSAPSRKLLEIPESVKKRFEAKGWVLGWIRVKGEGGDDNLITKERQGWRLLPASQVPEMHQSGAGIQKLEFLQRLNVNNGTTDGFIVRKDLALAANLASNMQKVKGQYLEEANRVERSLKSQVTNQGLQVDDLSVKAKVGQNADFG